MTIDQIKNFRSMGSLTPGHPEAHETDGVECTTGPLGQGVANAVGLAVSQKMAAARFNTEFYKILDNHVVCLAGDGCLQEGVSQEAASFAAHNHLDNLILIYDSNKVTLDAMADKTQSEMSRTNTKGSAGRCRRSMVTTWWPFSKPSRPRRKRRASRK
jgi:transketolase